MSDTRVLSFLFTEKINFAPASDIIKWRLGTNYSHVCGVVSTGPIGLFDLYEASHGNVHDIDLVEFLKKNKVVKTCRIQMDKESYYEVIRYLKKQRGKDYSEAAAIASTFKILRSLGIGKNGDGKFICSEYMARAYEQIGDIDYSKNRKFADYIDPLLFEKELVSDGHIFHEGLHLPEFGGY